MDFRPKLVGLLDYASQLAMLGERAIFRVSDYRSAVFHEHELRNRVGIHHDVVEGEERTWLKLDRLPRRDPPAVPKDIEDWITVGRDPLKQPTVQPMRVVTMTVEEADRLVAKGVAKPEDIQPALRERKDVPTAELRDVVLRLANNPTIEAAVRAYLTGPWTKWAEEEKPRRETIRIYEAFFSLQQAIETQGSERPLELVWGVGVARWKHPKQEIDHPLLEQLVEIDIDADDGAIRIRPRSTEPILAIKPYQELDLAGATALQRFAREHFRRLGAENEFSPFSNTSFEPVLRQAFSLLDAEGRYHPDHLEDVDDRSLPIAEPSLVVTDTWVIYLRPRSANFIVEDLDRLKAKVEEGEPEKLPGAGRRLVSIPDDTAPGGTISLPIELGTGLSQVMSDHAAPLGEELTFYFPKPFNDEQVDIVKRLSREDGVVVQGPPGTGKTHTIANIICHYMAIGRRVLVVSHGEAALGVLRDQIPTEVRQLAISLLTSERQGLKQLEQAVKLLADDVSQQNPKNLARSIDDGERRIIALKEKIAGIDAELQRLAAIHLKRFGGGDGILPMELAKHVAEARPLYSWFHDRPGTKQQPQFDESDVAKLRAARKALGTHLAYLGIDLPSPNDLPDAAVIAAIHEDLLSAQDIAARSRAGELPPLSLTVEDAFNRASELARTLDELIDALELHASEPWLQEIFDLACEFERRPETDALRRIYDLLTAVVAGRRQFVEKPVEISADVFSNDAMLRQLRDALSRQASGKSAFALLTSLGQGQIKRLHAAIRIDGEPVDTSEGAQHALAYLEWRAIVKDLYRRWNQLALELNLPQLDRDDDTLGRWATDARNKIAVQVAAARSHLPVASEELRILFPYGLSLNNLENVESARIARNALELNLSRQRLEASRVKLQDARSRLVSAAGIVERMRIFIDDIVGSDQVTALEAAEQWEALLRELKHLRELSPQLAIVQSTANRIAESGAPRWAERLVREPVDGQQDHLTPDDWRSAWLWAQQEEALGAISSRTQLSTLAGQRQSAAEELERVFRGVVRDRTFLMLTQTLTSRVRAALVMFGSAIRQIGAGTGIRARRFRRDAREAMDSCYSAVPCWIMPTWRVSENLPSILGSFDLVIVDEASQSDVLALPAILRGKKVLVVGDDKQVSPIAVAVEEKKILQLRHNYLADQPFAAMMVPGRSLYDLMSAVFPSQRTMLREHFRCVEPIIRFSAREFYDNQIRPLRIPKASERLDPPLIDIFVDHGWKEGKVNLPEARVVVDEIEKLVSDPAYRNRTIGVVSLIGANQAQKIQNMLLERIGEDTFLRHQIACGDSAAFQGKERDIMFVSMVAGANDTRALTGLMYEQRFNVALSRARDRMYLVRSVDETLLKPHDLKARVIRHFQNPMAGAPVDAVEGIALCESDFEREVYRKLVERGWRVRPQVKAGDYRIDLVIEGANDRRLAIELDGDKYHGPERWAEDYKRQLALERMGWRFWRCWGSSWALDPLGCLADLESTLKSLGIEPLGGEWAPARYTEHRIVRGPDIAKAGSVDEARREPGAFLYDEERVVEVGDKVVIAYNDDPGKTRTLILSPSEKDDPQTGIIYIGRPIAQALLGQVEQEIVELPAGQNAREATILRIEKGAVAA